jgi:hypothetical protein
MFAAIAFWHYYGGRKLPSCGIWNQAAQEAGGPSSSSSDEDGLARMKHHLQDLAGISVDTLLLSSGTTSPPTCNNNMVMNPGELGFFAAYLPRGAFRLTSGNKRGKSSKSNKDGGQAVVVALEVKVAGPGGSQSSHAGEFRFDDGFDGGWSEELSKKREEEGELEEEEVGLHELDLVAVTVTDTITKPSDAVALLLGLQSKGGEDGVSERVGVGFLYCSRAEGVPRPPWEYKFFSVK